MIKGLINIGCGLLVLYVLWRVYYFVFIRRAVKHYGETRKTEREYEKQIEAINRGEENEKVAGSDNADPVVSVRADDDSRN